jgi:hypothetical protein
LNFGNPYPDTKTHFSYDLSHDDGTANAYITQNWCKEKAVFFKDVKSAKFYAEGYITVTSAKAYENDPYPKLGMVAKGNGNHVFFYEDLINGKNFGTVEARYGSINDFDWSTSEITQVNNISTLNGNFVKLAILRKGINFYFFVNDVLVQTRNDFRIWTSTTPCSVGFYVFNVELRIERYSYTTVSAEVDDILDSYI